jgi:hypothetical protein
MGIQDRPYLGLRRFRDESKLAKVRILIAVKTYPTLSKKYIELACTAGFRENGEWIRIYPVKFRLLNEDNRYKKYQWIEADVARNTGDIRPESFRVLDADTIRLMEEVGTEREWSDRRQLILDKNKIYTNRDEIVDLAHENKLSLVIFKPTEIVDFIAEPADRVWAPSKLDAVLNSLKQQDLFGDQNLEEFKIMPKLPYKFSYRFKDDAGNESKLMIEDWETGQLYWNCVKRAPPEDAVRKVRQKYLDDFAKTKDLYFFLGTTREWHVRKAPNPFVIVGTFHPPHIVQESLF